MFLHVLEAKHLKEYTLEVVFSDGRKGIVDLKDSLRGSAFQELKDVQFFSKLTVDKELETVSWPNGVDFAPEYLFYKAFKDVPELQKQFENWGYKGKAERIRLDCESGANHNLNRLLDKPGYYI